MTYCVTPISYLLLSRWCEQLCLMWDMKVFATRETWFKLTLIAYTNRFNTDNTGFSSSKVFIKKLDMKVKLAGEICLGIKIGGNAVCQSVRVRPESESYWATETG